MSERRENITLTRDELQSVVQEGVHEALIQLGIEVDEIHQMQRDFLFLRELRETHERVKSKGLLILVGTVIAGAVTLLILGLRSWFNVP